MYEMKEDGGEVFVRNGSRYWMKPVMFGDEFFASVKTMAKETGYSGNGGQKAISTKLPTWHGKEIRYATLEEIKASLPIKTVRIAKPKRSGRGVPIMVEGTVYENQKECRKALHVCKETVSKMLKDGHAHRLEHGDTPEAPPEEQATPQQPKFVFEGVLWSDNSVTVRIPGTPFSMTRPSLDQLPVEIQQLCVIK